MKKEWDREEVRNSGMGGQADDWRLQKPSQGAWPCSKGSEEPQESLNMVRRDSLPRLWGEWFRRCQNLGKETKEDAQVRLTGPGEENGAWWDRREGSESSDN